MLTEQTTEQLELGVSPPTEPQPEPRRSLSVRVRFEVFKRDAFICQYCGRRPPEVSLVCDHIEPWSRGGSDDIGNLVTSCIECNGGKSDIPLGVRSPLSGARLACVALEAEAKDVEAYIRHHKTWQKLKAVLIVCLKDLWRQHLPIDSVPDDAWFTEWLAKFGPEELERAIKTVAREEMPRKRPDVPVWLWVCCTVRFMRRAHLAGKKGETAKA